MEQKIDGRKKNRGIPGKAGAKRKPESEKKITVGVYVKRSDVDALGGKARIRDIALSAIVKELSIQ